MSKQIDPDLKGLTTLSLSSYQINRPNKGIISIGSARTLKECGFEDYKKARVEKLRELYSKLEPDYEYYYELPEGETDGRKAVRMEKIIGEDISPFDLPDFEDLMPNWEDYVDEYQE